MSGEAPGQSIQLAYDYGAAYDLFISLITLHNPEKYALRASWAAGVRSRLPAGERKFLEEVIEYTWAPFTFIHQLPEPKDAATALWALRQIPPAERLLSILPLHKNAELEDIFKDIATRGAWDKNDLDRIKKLSDEKSNPQEVKRFTRFLDWCVKPEEFGELYLSALQAYHQSFFAEEEKRITPYLRQGIEKARELAEHVSLQDLLVELSQGVHFNEPFHAEEIVLIPSFWTTPLVMWTNLDKDHMAFVFGARPADVSLLPGEAVPDGLLRGLKAIDDPTRLQILRILSLENLTQAQLARRLRLRAPTITHHLNALRLAGLVHLTVSAGDERLYSARLEAVRAMFGLVDQFLGGNKTR